MKTKTVISTKFQLKDLYESYKERTGKTIQTCEGKEVNPLCPACWIDLVVALSFEFGEYITLSKGMTMLAV